MVNSREEAVRRASANQRNTPGTCQLWTRTMFAAPSAGDRDRDGDADAVDGWLSEPSWARHEGDMNPPAGVPVAWSGGRKGYGHRAVSIGGGMVRSTDAPHSGQVGTVSIEWINKNWGLKYLGWSETITGQTIPFTPPKEEPKKSRGWRVDRALKLLKKAEQSAKGERKKTLTDLVKRVERRAPFIK